MGFFAQLIMGNENRRHKWIKGRPFNPALSFFNI
jgi:hypothetical protein